MAFAHSRPGSLLTYYAQGAANAVDTVGPEGGGGQGRVEAGGDPLHLDVVRWTGGTWVGSAALPLPQETLNSSRPGAE